AGNSLWVLPPQFGLWVPALTAHQVRMPKHVSMRTLYIRRSLANFGPECRVLHVSPFLRELILQIVKLGKLRARNPMEHSLVKILLWQLGIASPLPTGVAMPVDPRAFAVAQATLQEPASTVLLGECCRAAGVGVRTLQRIFRKELGQD